MATEKGEEQEDLLSTDFSLLDWGDFIDNISFLKYVISLCAKLQTAYKEATAKNEELQAKLTETQKALHDMYNRCEELEQTKWWLELKQTKRRLETKIKVVDGIAEDDLLIL